MLHFSMQYSPAELIRPTSPGVKSDYQILKNESEVKSPPSTEHKYIIFHARTAKIKI